MLTSVLFVAVIEGCLEKLIEVERPTPVLVKHTEEALG